MKFGIIPAHGPDHLADAIEQVQLARGHGFDSIWIEEHHAAGPYWPTPLLAIAALVPHLGGLTIGTDVLVLPLHDPAHVAEQAAALDRMTGGRFILGVGLGDTASEFATFRVPGERRGARFEEQLEIIRALWTGETLSYKGRFYELEGAQLGIRPLSAGGPPIWIGGWGPRQIERAARLADTWIPGPVARVDEVAQRQKTYEATLERLGQDPSQRPRPITRDVIIATRDGEAWALALEQVLTEYAETYADDSSFTGESGVRPEQTSTTSRDQLRSMAKDRLIIGGPETVTAQVMECARRLRPDHMIFRLKLPGLESHQITTMMHLLGEQVLPRLRRELTRTLSVG